jgi:prevent-host-death family protein
MEKQVSAADANRKFSKLLRGVRDGQSYVITSHGKAVAKIVPLGRNGGACRAGHSRRPAEETALPTWGQRLPLAPEQAVPGLAFGVALRRTPCEPACGRQTGTCLRHAGRP